MKLRQALILAINTSILAVLFVFMSWLYWSEKSGVEAAVRDSAERAGKITGELASLRERELAALARSLSGSPMVRGALATGDRETIDDVLAGVAAKNKVSVEVRRGGKSVFGKPAPAAALQGEAEAGEGTALRLSQAPDSELLRSWSAVTGAAYALDAAAHSLPEGEDEPALRAQPRSGSPAVVSGKQAYYASELSLRDGRLRLSLYQPRDAFWKPFERKRNSLVVLGAALFFLGLLLSVGFAEAVERLSRGAATGRSEEWQRLLDEIEALRPERRR